MPENTLPAFEKAIELGVTTLELDVVISKDNKVVVSHEPYMNHEICLKPDGSEIPESEENDFNLYKMNYDSIVKFDCGIKNHPRFPNQKKIEVHKPLLSEVISMAEEQADKSIHYNVEIKSDPSYDGKYSPKIAEFVALVIDVIEESGVLDRTTLQSFDLRGLEEIHKQKPNVNTALLVDENESIEQKLDDLSFKPKIISPYFKLLDAENISDFQSKGFKIIPWTINEISDMEQIMSLEVDGIITDYPDRLINLIAED